MPIVGDVLAGRYRVDAPLGAGGMASVYRAHDLRLDRDVAVKVLLPNLAADPLLAARFEREARSLAAAAHPNIVTVFDVEPGDRATGREPFYVMELCDGGSLADRLAGTANGAGATRGEADGRALPSAVAATIGSVAEGLRHLHSRGMVHRDVKPHNILFSGDRAKLADFGLARTESPGETSALTAPGTTVGTLAYLAPELIGGAAATPASDVYALGVTAFQALTGRLPRDATSMSDLVEARTAPAPTVSSVAPDLGPGFDEPVAQALSGDPGARPSPLELASGLAAAASAPVANLAAGAAARTEPALATRPRFEEPAAGPVPASSDRVAGGATRRSLRRRPALVALIAFALVVAALLILSSLLRAPGGGPGAGTTRRPTAPATTRRTPSPTPTAPPSTIADPARAAIDAVNRLEAAISAATGGKDGLKGKEANDLAQRAEAVRASLLHGDFSSAAALASDLQDRIDNIDGDRAQSLRDAAASLVDAIPG